MTANTPTPKQIAEYLHSVENIRCNCDLDNWEPTQITGHSPVCRIHKSVTARPYDMRAGLLDAVQSHISRIAP